MLETIRQFAWDKLREAGELEELRARHRDWCLALAEAAELMGAGGAAREARLVAEQDNFRAALDWDAEALVGLGQTAVVQGRYEEARTVLEQAVREARAAADAHLAALALNFVGNGLYLQGAWTEAQPVFEQVREGFQAIGNLHGVAVVTIQIGLCALEGGDQHEARALVREGLQLARELDFRWGELYGLDGAALLAARTSNWEVAATLLGATELLREASPAPQIRVRETAIAAVKPAIDPDTLSACGTRAKPYPWTRQPPTHSSISSHRIRHNLYNAVPISATKHHPPFPYTE